MEKEVPTDASELAQNPNCQKQRDDRTDVSKLGKYRGITIQNNTLITYYAFLLIIAYIVSNST